MTNRKQLHNWMKENNFLQSDYQKIRDLYFDTFQQVLPFRINVGNGINPKTFKDFRKGLKMFGFTSNENTLGHLTATIGVEVKDCKDCEYFKKDKDDVTFAKCSFGDNGNLVLDRLIVRSSMGVTELNIERFSDRKELTDKEKFNKWFYDNGYSALVDYNEKQDKLLKKLSAINMICLCAKYLNGGQCNIGFHLMKVNNEVKITALPLPWTSNPIMFRNRDLAQKAIEILGEDLIKTAYSTDY